MSAPVETWFEEQADACPVCGKGPTGVFPGQGHVIQFCIMAHAADEMHPGYGSACKGGIKAITGKVELFIGQPPGQFMQHLFNQIKQVGAAFAVDTHIDGK